MQLSVVIPVYNAAALLEKNLTILLRQLNSLNFSYEILLCDDGSQDNSPVLLKEISRRCPGVACFFNEHNFGLGHTLKFLFAKATGETVVYCDIDLPFGAEVIQGLLQTLEQGADVAVASRYLGGRHRIPWSRKVMSRLYYLWCKLLFDIPVRDIGSGSIALKRRVIEKLDLHHEGFSSHAEFFLQVQRQGFVIQEMSWPSSEPQPGTFDIFRHGPQVVNGTIQLWRELRIQNNKCHL